MPQRADGDRLGDATVKGCGKSAPRAWQQGRHGKPHREQDRIGVARAHSCVRGVFPPATRVGRLSLSVTAGLEEWSPIRICGGQNPAYRPSGNSIRIVIREVRRRAAVPFRG
ncbi:conserved hypothetical protein [Sphingomonas sp. EC-HK361]|nr:conserved hypothetical protein [Sphingomonas sp. EC-HK361]